MTDDRTAIAVISEISGVQNNHNPLVAGAWTERKKSILVDLF